MMIPDAQTSGFQRVAVVGTSCVGKTTFARKLSKSLGAHYIELDALYWQPEWVERPLSEFRLLVEQETSVEWWVADGNYSSVRDIVWGRSTDIVWLNYSFPTVLSRALRRTVRRILTREELFSGNRCDCHFFSFKSRIASLRGNPYYTIIHWTLVWLLAIIRERIEFGYAVTSTGEANL